MKFRKGARQEYRQLKKQKKHAQSVRYLEWQRTGHGDGGRIQKKKGSMNMRGINGQMNRIFTQLDIYEKPQSKTQPQDNKHHDGGDGNSDSDDSTTDLGDRLERAYRDRGSVEKTAKVKESREDRIARLQEENEAEDKEIAKLEKLLYLNKRKNNNMPKSFVDEGLDFIMELVDKKYKKKYNDDMELLEEQGELSNALAGQDGKAHDEDDDEDEESSADEFTEKNEKRRKIKFADEQGDDSEDVESDGSMDVEDFDEEQSDELDEEASDDLDVDGEEEDEESLDDSGSVEDHQNESDMEDDDDSEADDDGTVMQKLKAYRDSKKSASNKSIDHNEADGTKIRKKKTEETADDVMEKLKAMREAKKGGNISSETTDMNVSKKKRLVELVHDSDLNKEKNYSQKKCQDEVDEGDSADETDNSEEDEEGDEDSQDSNRSDNEDLDDDEEEDTDSVKADDFIRKKNKVAADGTYEDIYGRKRSAQGDVIDSNNQKYIPPGKRLAMSGANGDRKIELEKLQKQVKGQLNRLSETNLRPISVLISELYSRHSKNNVTSVLSVAISDAVFGLSQTPERLVLEPALLCALLHANEGHEVGAQILEDVIDRLKSLLENEEERIKGKQLENVLRFLCYLFLFKVVSHGIVYGVLNKLDPTNENDVELILAVLRTCGFALRKCDPLALKELILSLQTKCRESETSSRHRFMLDTLMALKNNNISKISNCDPSLSERALKSLRACLNKGAVLQELNVSLEDLYDARRKGKWWLVGSAWTNEQSTDKKDTSKRGSLVTAVTDEFSSKIMDLARKAGMNTDIRRAIFGIIMSAEDYIDASERLLRLNLTHVQQRELCYVLLLCAGNEKRFNPYYGHLALFFCNQNKKVFSMTLQCAIWDAVKAIGSYSENKISNLARFTSLLVCKGGLPLAVLKNIEFVDLSNDKVIQFLRILLLDVMLNLKTEDVSRLFAKVALAGPKLNLLKEGLGVFIKRFLLRNVKLNDMQMNKVKKNIKAAEEGLSTQIEKSEIDIFE